ncbi:MAG TPA: alpha/beta fold hydrolase [Longimicrobium sp.]
MTMRARGWSAALLLAASCAPSLRTGGSAPLPLSDCTLPGVAGAVRCGVVHVAEDSLAPGGRTVPLFVAVLPATGQRLGDPLFFLSGGPGQAPSDQAEFVASLFAALRPSRDLVLVDLRGTGRSAALDCDFHGGEPGRVMGEPFPVAAVRACRDSLSRRADLRLYTTGRAMRDLEQVRHALGYERINLYGTSYGTRAALEYARRYPSRVRSMILRGVTPPSLVVPLPFARDAQRSLDLLFDECRSDGACRAAYPDLPATSV